MSITSPDFDPWAERHPSVRHFKGALTPNPKLPPAAQEMADVFHETALYLLNKLEDGPELSAALRSLWEAKNSAVLQQLIDVGQVEG